MCGWIGNCILARAPIRQNSAWKALGVIGPSPPPALTDGPCCAPSRPDDCRRNATNRAAGRSIRPSYIGFSRRCPPPQPASPASAQRDAMADALVAELRAVIADLRQDRDRWREAFERQQRALPMATQLGATGEATETGSKEVPVSRLRRAWRWMQARG